MSKRSIRLGMLAGLVALVGTTLAACGTQTSTQASGAKPLAVINGEAMTKADWHTAVYATDLLQGVSLPTTKSAEKEQVQELASEIVVEQWALKHHVVTLAAAKTNAEKFMNENVRDALGGPSKEKAALAKDHLTVSSLTQFMVKQMELQAVFSQETKAVPAVTATQAEAYYNAHKSEFVTPSQVEMRMILVKTKPLAEKIEAELEHGGSWMTLAKEYSLDTYSKDKGGEYGWVDTGAASNFVKPFYVEMDMLKPGQYGIAHSQYGYHVIEVQAARAGSNETFASVKTNLETELLNQKRNAVFETFSNKVEKASKITINF